MPTSHGAGSKLVIVSVKAFGDLIIAVTSLARISSEARHRVTLLIGEHLAPLASVLTMPVDMRVLRERLHEPAPLFDVRRLGTAAAIASAISLRQSFGRALRPGETLVFDTWGVRERFLGLGRSARGLPPAANVYAAYETLFRESGLPMTETAKAIRTPTERGLVRIFAGARMDHRRPPAALLHRAVELVEAKGGRAEVILLDGERPDLERESLPLTVVPRDFGAMLDVMREADAVISPDSMTAHLAEYCNKPVLVLTPAEKFYWMPRFSAENGMIALFQDDLATGPLETLLSRYLAG